MEEGSRFGKKSNRSWLMSEVIGKIKRDQGQEQEWHHVVMVEDLGDLKRKINVSYDADGVCLAMKKAADVVRSKVDIKGFRRGKAPLQVIEQFCKEDIKSMAKALLSQEGWLHAKFEHNIVELDKPEVCDECLHLDGTFSCDIYVEVRPDVTPTGYVGMKLTRPLVNVDDMYSDLMKILRQRLSIREERDKVAPEMIVTFDYYATVDGEKVVSRVNQNIISNAEGKGSIFDGEIDFLEKNLGDTIEKEVELPEKVGKHGGNKATLTLNIKKIEETIPPTDEELVQRAKVDSFEELDNMVKQQAELEANKYVRQSFENQIVDNLLELNDFQVPSSWVDNEVRYLSESLRISDPNEEEAKSIQEISEKNVKRTFIFDALYDAEPSLKISPGEVQEFLQQEAKSKGITLVRLKRAISEQNVMDSVIAHIKNAKILEFLLSNADITDEEAEQQGETPLNEGDEDEQS
jgi:trigger factor